MVMIALCHSYCFILCCRSLQSYILINYQYAIEIINIITDRRGCETFSHTNPDVVHSLLQRMTQSRFPIDNKKGGSFKK